MNHAKDKVAETNGRVAIRQNLKSNCFSVVEYFTHPQLSGIDLYSK